MELEAPNIEIAARLSRARGVYPYKLCLGWSIRRIKSEGESLKRRILARRNSIELFDRLAITGIIVSTELLCHRR